MQSIESQKAPRVQSNAVWPGGASSVSQLSSCAVQEASQLVYQERQANLLIAGLKIEGLELQVEQLQQLQRAQVATGPYCWLIDWLIGCLVALLLC